MHEIPVAARHRPQQHARDTYDVALDVVDGRAVAGMLTQGDLVWITQRFLDLPSSMIPDEPAGLEVLTGLLDRLVEAGPAYRKHLDDVLPPYAKEAGEFVALLREAGR